MQRQGHKLLQESKAVYDIQQDEEPYIRKNEDSGKNFDLVDIRYLNSDNVKLVTKLESNTTQKSSNNI